MRALCPVYCWLMYWWPLPLTTNGLKASIIGAYRLLRSMAFTLLAGSPALQTGNDRILSTTHALSRARHLAEISI